MSFFITKIKNQYVILCIILLLAAILRIAYLSIIPNGIASDELDYMLNAKAYFQTGRDLLHQTNFYSPFIFDYPSTHMPQAELPYLLLLPIVGPLSFSLFNSRILFALASLVNVYLLFLIARKLFNLQAGLWVVLIAAINPWFIYIGRTAYEAGLALPFYLLGLYMLITAKKWHLLWSVPVFTLAFYAYIGTKLLFLPFVILASVFGYRFIHHKKYLTQYLIIMCYAFVMVIFFFIAVNHFSPNTRISEIYLPSSPDVSSQVDKIRASSIANPLMFIFENKLMVYIRILLIRFFNIFSPVYLFSSGDAFFSLYRVGLFYYIDALFFCIGVLSLFKKNSRLFLYLISFIIVCTIPQVFHESQDNFTPHITLLFPFFILIIGYGIYSFTQIFSSSNLKKWVSLLIIAAYAVMVFNFVNIYFFEFPTQGFFDFQSRVLSHYIVLAKSKNTPLVIYTPDPVDAFEKYIYYANMYNSRTTEHIKTALLTKNLTFGNITFAGCSKQQLGKRKTTIINTACNRFETKTNYLVISRLSDAGYLYRIYNDHICQGLALQNYPSNITLNDFYLESMDKDSFCNTYIYQSPQVH